MGFQYSFDSFTGNQMGTFRATGRDVDPAGGAPSGYSCKAYGGQLLKAPSSIVWSRPAAATSTGSNAYSTCPAGYRNPT